MFIERIKAGAGMLPDSLGREFSEVYQTIVSAKGIKTDEEELDLVNQLIRRAEQGSYPEDGSMHIVSPGARVDWSSDAAHRAVQPPPERSYGVVAGGILMGVALLIALLSILGGGDKRNTSGDESLAVALQTATALSARDTTSSRTPAPNTTQTALAQATAVWANSVVEVGTDYKQKLPPLYPESLEIGGVPFRVYPSAISNGTWTYEPLEGTSSWIGGTIINWCFGLPALASNKAVFERLEQAGDTDRIALVRMSGGLVRRYRLQKPVQVERQQIEILVQNQPGITLVLLGDEQNARRWIIRGSKE